VGIDLRQVGGNLIYQGVALNAGRLGMWTVEKLLEASKARGEFELAPMVERALLAHERWKGRTEERYPADKAKGELDAFSTEWIPSSCRSRRQRNTAE